MKNKAERYRGERFQLLDRVPFAMRQVLCIGAGKGELGYLLRKREGVIVHGTDENAAFAPICGVTLDRFFAVRFGGVPVTLPLPERGYDAIILLDGDQLEGGWECGLLGLRPYMHPHTWVMALAPADFTEQYDQALADAGLTVYDTHTPEQEWPQEARLVVLVPQGYHLFDHVHAVIAGGHPNRAFQLLDMAPLSMLSSMEARPLLMVEKINCLRRWGQSKPAERYAFLYKSLELFSETMRYDHHNRGIFESVAAYFRSEGVQEIAERFENILEQALTTAAKPPASPPLSLEPIFPSYVCPSLPPQWFPRERLPRILYLIHPHPHYGVDVLYDGLCELLGDAQVTEYPYKPTFHGEINPKYAHYPCNTHRQGQRYELEEVLGQLQSGYYDLLVFGDFELEMDKETVKTICAAATAGGAPIALVDQTDTFDDLRSPLVCALDLPLTTCYFKRELMPMLDYGRNVFPLPFAYMDSRVPAEVDGVRDNPVFWAGHRNFGTRRHYLERLEKVQGKSFDVSFTQDIYSQLLKRSRIGVNLAGAGFDTVRYWELPAHGVLLFSESMPIVIPENFVDGVDAVFFRDLDEMEERLAWCLAHPEETAVIAGAGRDRFLKHHTASARAHQFLGWLRMQYPGRI